jgi:hypothetical protein
MAATLYIYRCSTDRAFFLATLTDEIPTQAESVCTAKWTPFREQVTAGITINAFPSEEIIVQAIINSGVGYCTFRAGFGTIATAPR